MNGVDITACTLIVCITVYNMWVRWLNHRERG